MRYHTQAAAALAAAALMLACAGTALASNAPVDGVSLGAAQSMLAQAFTAGVTGELTGVDGHQQTPRAGHERPWARHGHAPGVWRRGDAGPQGCRTQHPPVARIPSP